MDLSDLLQTIVIYRKLPTFDTEKALNEGNGAEPCQTFLNLLTLAADQLENYAPNSPARTRNLEDYAIDNAVIKDFAARIFKPIFAPRIGIATGDFSSRSTEISLNENNSFY